VGERVEAVLSEVVVAPAVPTPPKGIDLIHRTPVAIILLCAQTYNKVYLKAEKEASGHNILDTDVLLIFQASSKP
jgi:hypothetical protein